VSIDITVTIVTYKTDLAVLDAAVKCIHSNSFNIYVVIADNDSGSSYFSVLQSKYRNSDINVVSTGKNGGYGYGHNYAETQCPESKYHLVMNADVKFDSQCIDYMYHYMQAHDDLVLIAPKALNPDGSLQYLNKRTPTVLDLLLRRITPSFLQDVVLIKKRLDYYEMRDVDHDQEYDLDLVSGCFMFLSREAFRKVKGFDESYFMYFEDFDLSKRLSAFGRMAYVPKCEIVHYWGRGSKHSSSLLLSLFRSAVVYFNRWGWRFW
jgi:GT2 family glycosyltransferase